MKTLMTMCSVILLLAATAKPAHAAADPTMRTTLRATLDRHLAAINARDLEALLATVTHGDKLVLILPDSSVLGTRDEYRRLHVDWFKQRDWRMVFDVQDVTEYGNVGIARVRYDSQTKDADGHYFSKRIALLSLVFASEGGEWRLVYDQNTVIPAGGAPAGVIPAGVVPADTH